VAEGAPGAAAVTAASGGGVGPEHADDLGLPAQRLERGGHGVVTLPALEIAPPSIYWGAGEVAIDAFHHAVYAAATGLAYTAITR